MLTVEADGSYRPKTRETRAAYEALLGMIQGQFGDQPADVLRGAAEEVLEVLKDDRSTDPKRKKDVEKLMGATSDERFAQFVAVGKLITDAPGGVAPGEGDAPGDALDDAWGSRWSSKNRRKITMPMRCSRRATWRTRTRARGKTRESARGGGGAGRATATARSR